MIMNFWVPYTFGKSLNSCTTGGFSRRAQLHEASKLVSSSVVQSIAYNYKMIVNNELERKRSGPYLR
jgi:hypothetical protein